MLTADKIFWTTIFLLAALIGWLFPPSAYGSEIKRPHVIYDCPKSKTITYSYIIEGVTLLDTDTGEFHIATTCMPINGYEVIWEGEENATR